MKRIVAKINEQLVGGIPIMSNFPCDVLFQQIWNHWTVLKIWVNLILILVNNGICTKIPEAGRGMVAKASRSMPVAGHLLRLLREIWATITSVVVFFTTTIFTLGRVQIELLMCDPIRIRWGHILTPIWGVTPLIKGTPIILSRVIILCAITTVKASTKGSTIIVGIITIIVCIGYVPWIFKSWIIILKESMKKEFK